MICKEIQMSKERGGGLIFLAVGIYGLIFSVPLPLGKWNQPGPAIFPLGLSILLCIFGVSWFVHGKREKRETVGLGKFVRKYITPLKIIGITAAYILTFDLLGYLLTSTLYLFILLLWVSHYRLWVAAMLAIGFGIGSWLFFGKLLATPLPKGILS
jgi:putative tricarboxylic transport membrane protein